MKFNKNLGQTARGAGGFLCKSLAALAFAGVLSVGVAVAEESTSTRATIAGTHPRWANESRRIPAAAVTSGTVSARVYLAGRDPAGLAAYATAVSTPGDDFYGHFLSP